jgi:hypothetical protein
MAVRRSQRWEVGTQDERDLFVSLPRSRDDSQTYPWETIVVTANERLPTAQLWEMTVEQVDFGGIIGPIHLPCTIHVPGAQRLLVRPTTVVSVSTEIYATTYLADHRGFRSFAQWSKVAGLAEVIPIPAGVRAVGCVDPATFVFVDRVGVDLTSALDSACDRPALAVEVRAVTAGLVIFYY